MLPTHTHGVVKTSQRNVVAYTASNAARTLTLFIISWQLASAFSSLSIIFYLFTSLLLASLFFLPLQRPWDQSKKRITQEQWGKIAQHSVVFALSSYLWLYGLRCCGPCGVVLVECIELFLPTFSHLILSLRQSNAQHHQQQDPSNRPPSSHTSHMVKGIGLALFGYVVLWLSLSETEGQSATLGLVALVVSAICTHQCKSRERQLGQAIGGPKRLHALVVPLAAGCTFLPAMAYRSWMSVNELVLLLCIVFLLFVVSFYVDVTCSPTLTSRVRQQSGLLLPVAIATSVMVWTRGLAVSGPIVVASLCVVFGAGMFHSSESQSDSHAVRSSDRRSLPVIFTPSVKSFRLFMRSVLEGRDTRRIFMFLCLNLSFTFVEAIYGYLTNSLSLISDASHMLFDCTALIIGLYAAYMSKWRPNQVFSFGYGRFEVLSGFVNAVFLVIIAFMVVVESIERLVDPPEVDTSKLLVVSTAGFLVNMIGIMFFHEHHGHSHTAPTECSGGHSHAQHGHQHGEPKSKHNHNMEGIFLHILADTLGSVGVIVSTLLIDKFHWYIADPICSLIISGLILASVVSLLRSSVHILTQRVPQHLESSLEGCLSEVRQIEGVVSCVQPHFWTFINEEIVGTARVAVSSAADPQAVLRKASSVMTSHGVRKVTIQIERERAQQ